MKRVLFDSDFDYEEDYNEFVKETNSNITYYDFTMQESEISIQELFNDFEEITGSCVVCGTLGLWNGTKEIIPTRFSTLEQAVRKCISDYYSFKIEQVNGHLEISSYHHDGTNNFIVYLLNDKGENTINGDLNNRRYHKAIKFPY